MTISITILTTTSVNIFEDWGTLFMSLILISFLLSVFFVVKGFFKAGTDNSHTEKMIELAKDFSYLSLILGLLTAALTKIGIVGLRLLSKG